MALLTGLLLGCFTFLAFWEAGQGVGTMLGLMAGIVMGFLVTHGVLVSFGVLPATALVAWFVLGYSLLEGLT